MNGIDADGFRCEAAQQFGFETTIDYAAEYECTQAQLIAFAKACEYAGVAQAVRFASAGDDTYRGPFDAQGIVDELERRIAALDAVIREAEEVRFMTARGYVRDTREQTKGWRSGFSSAVETGAQQSQKPWRAPAAANLARQVEQWAYFHRRHVVGGGLRHGWKTVHRYG
jgi:hypothetical protein